LRTIVLSCVAALAATGCTGIFHLDDYSTSDADVRPNQDTGTPPVNDGGGDPCVVGLTCAPEACEIGRAHV
jgi:hypothetical protein